MLIATDSHYLKLPVSRTANTSKVRLFDGKRLLIDLDVRFDASSEAYMYYDVSRFDGCDVTVVHESGYEFELVSAVSEPPHESCRPSIHFTAPYGWINDPNGLILYEGNYHIFYQHNPAGTSWGNMHWGHAVSRDLVHFEHRDEALFPDELGDMYSGSAIIDHDNRLGLNTPEHEALLLFYTAAGGNRELNAESEYFQCLAYSTDGGVTFKKYEGNPIVKHIKAHNRDPKVIHDEVSGLYLMALYLDGNEYALLTSGDLVNWTQLQTFHLVGDDECPDIFPMDNGRGERKWVILGAHDRYTVCDFNPTVGFVNFTEARTLGFGACYAAQSFNGISDRRIRFSWNRFGQLPSEYFNCEMSVPCELKLFGNELRIAPVSELTAAYTESIVEEALPSHGICRKVGTSCDITLALSRLEEAVTVMLCGCEIKLDPMNGSVTLGDKNMPLCPYDGCANVRIIADNCGIEIFTGIEDGYAKAFGAFAYVLTDDMLTIRGEGSLDRLCINKF